MSLKNIDIDSALRRIADRRIEEAMKEGKFDNLAGMGKPLDLESMPAEENARMTWWALRILKQNDVIPDEVVWRKSLDRQKELLEQLKDEKMLPALVARINALVRQINNLGTNALVAPVAPIEEETERQKLRDRLV